MRRLILLILMILCLVIPSNYYDFDNNGILINFDGGVSESKIKVVDSTQSLPKSKGQEISKLNYDELIEEYRMIMNDIAQMYETNEFEIDRTVSIKSEVLESVLNDNLVNYADDFIEISKCYNLNVYFIVAVAALESGWGTSDLSLSKNNYFGVMKADGSGNFVHYDSFKDSLESFAQLIRSEYLSENSYKYHGNTVEDIGVSYNGREEWVERINGLIVDLTLGCYTSCIDLSKNVEVNSKI